MIDQVQLYPKPEPPVARPVGPWWGLLWVLPTALAVPVGAIAAVRMMFFGGVVLGIPLALVYQLLESLGLPLPEGESEYFLLLLALPLVMATGIGLTVGIVQWLMLRTHLPRSRSWWVVTPMGAYLGALLGFTLSLVISPWASGGAREFGALLGVLAVIGAGVGTAQWWVLRQIVARAAWWIAGNAAAVGVAFLVYTGSLRVVRPPAGDPVPLLDQGLALLAGGAAGAVITGGVLVWILRTSMRRFLVTATAALAIVMLVFVARASMAMAPFWSKGDVSSAGITQVGGQGEEIAWSPDGRRLATAARDGVHVFSRSGEEVDQFSHEGAFRQDISWSPDSRWIATTASWGAAKNTTLFHVETRKQHTLVAPAESNGGHRPAWSADGKYFSVETSRGIQVWNAVTQKPEALLFLPPDDTTPLQRELGDYDHLARWSPMRTEMAVVAQALFSRTRYAIRLWHPGPPSSIRQLFEVDAPVNDVAWSPDGTQLAIALRGELRVYLAADPSRPPRILPVRDEGRDPEDYRESLTRVLWSPTGEWIAGSRPRDIVVWSAGTWREVARRSAVGCAGDSWITWAPDDGRLAFALEHTVHIWDVAGGRVRVLRNGTARGGFCRGLWSPDGSSLATVSPGNVVLIWDLGRR